MLQISWKTRQLKLLGDWENSVEQMSLYVYLMCRRRRLTSRGFRYMWLILCRFWKACVALAGKECGRNKEGCGIIQGGCGTSRTLNIYRECYSMERKVAFGSNPTPSHHPISDLVQCPAAHGVVWARNLVYLSRLYFSVSRRKTARTQ